MPSFIQKIFAGGIALALALAGSAYGQGVTTAAMNGFVNDKDGKPVSGATVTAVHVPTGTTVTAVTRSNGQFNFSGLRLGGPYTVTASPSGYRGETRSNVYLDASSPQDISFGLTADVVVMQAMTVEADSDLTFDGGLMGSTTSFDSQRIADTASIRRNIQDVAVQDSHLFLNSLDQGGQLSAQGQNFRFNSLLIDGVQANDPFGLQGSGFSSLRSPVPFEALQAFSVELNPYDVRRSGFTGALLNAVTKSGTNKISGMVYGEYTDLNVRARNPNTKLHEPFRERTYGFNVGGPLIPNKLFFFISEDDFRRSSTAPSQVFTPDATVIGQIVARAKAVGYDPGSFTGATSFATQKTWIAKLDWNITNAHRLSVQYRDNYGTSPIYTNFANATETSFSNYWFDAPLHTHGYTAQLFSNWASNLRTELSIGHTSFNGSPHPHSNAFPEVFIGGVTGVNTSGTTISGTVDLGVDASRQLNGIVTKSDTLAGSAEYSIGNHTVVLGGDYEKKQVWDAFVQRYYGSYTFSTVADWLAGTNAKTLSQLTLSPGTGPLDPLAIYTYIQRGVYLQDMWKPSPRLTVNAGIRWDSPYLPHGPIPIPTTTAFSEAAFRTAFGISSQTGNSNNAAISPRIGFNYELATERKTQIRGGVGIFSGTNPSVYLANPYQNRGVTSNVVTNGVAFSPTINPPTVGAPGSATVNVTDPSFRTPITIKGNLAIDHALPWGGIVVSVEGSFVNVERGLFSKNINLKPVGTTPDGRIQYAGIITAASAGSRGSSNSNPYNNLAFYQNAGFADVYYLTNTKKGGGGDFTLSARRAMKNGWGWSVSWTASHYTEVSPSTSSTATSNFNTRKVTNSNEDVASLSNTNVPYRIVSTLNYQLHLIKNAPTDIAITYQGRTGHNYSWVFFGDANGDGYTFNDLFYMPTGPNDPKVRWNSTTERDNFFDYAQKADLTRFAGQVVPRNSETSPWVNTVDLKFTQTIPIHGNLKAEVYMNLINFGNLLNRKWGLQSEVQFSYGRAIAGTTYDAAANQYVYTFTPSTLNPVTTIFSADPVSRWQIQSGMRIKF